MKRLWIICYLIVLMIPLCFAQVKSTDSPVLNDGETIQELEIQIKTMLPDINIVRLKTDTYIPAGQYNYIIYKDLIKAENIKELINWQKDITKQLEESK
jgi:hypothetical protein